MAGTSSASPGRSASTVWPTRRSWRAINGGSHVAPCHAGDTVSAWSEVLDRAETDAPGVGALRVRTVAVKAGATEPEDGAFRLRDDDGKYLPGVLLDLDYWVLAPC